MRSMMQWTSLLMLTAGLTAGCTSRSRSVEVTPEAAERPQITTPQVTSVTGPSTGVESVLGSRVDAPDQASTGMLFHEKALQHNYSIDTSKLKYKFKYLSTEEGPKDIIFDAEGKKTLTFSGLKVGQSGTLSLELFEGDKLVLRGVKENLTLQAGNNNKVELTMQPVDATTDIVIDVTLGNGGSTPPPADVTNPGVVDPNTPPTPGTTPDPIAEWDGKSNKGNAEWNIVPVVGSPI